MSDPFDIENMAAAEHESWSGWATRMLDQQEREIREFYGNRRRGERSNRDRAAQAAVEEFRALPSTKRWRRQATTPYAELSEKEKESDRVEARKKLKVYRPMRGVHAKHGRGQPESGPDDHDCPCRGTPQQLACADAGCGFCVSAEQA